MTSPESAAPEIGEWLSTRDAAARLGVSERSVFRRLQKGNLRKRTASDGRVLVLLTSQDAVIPDVMAEEDVADRAPTDASGALAIGVMYGVQQQAAATLELFRSELRERDQAMARMAEELGRLRAELAWRRQPIWKRLLPSAVVMTERAPTTLSREVLGRGVQDVGAHPAA